MENWLQSDVPYLSKKIEWLRSHKRIRLAKSLDIAGTLIISIPNNVSIIRRRQNSEPRDALYSPTKQDDSRIGHSRPLPLLNRTCNERDCVIG